MRVEYEVTDEAGRYIEHGVCQLDSISEIVWHTMDNGHEIKIAPFYEED